MRRNKCAAMHVMFFCITLLSNGCKSVGTDAAPLLVPPGPKLMKIKKGSVSPKVIFTCEVVYDQQFPNSRYANVPGQNTSTTSRILLSGPLDATQFGHWETELDDAAIADLNDAYLDAKMSGPSVQRDIVLNNAALFDNLVANKVYHGVTLAWVDRSNQGKWIVSSVENSATSN